MKKLMTFAVAMVLAASMAWAETYRVNVSRVERNVYLDHESKTVIVTKWCYEYARRDDAVLFEDQYGSWKLLFVNSQQVCDVKEIR